MSLLVRFIISFGLLMIAVTVHEFAHGWIAYRRGDRTAKYSGRLTLNPLAHIGPFWTLILPLLLFISTGGRFVFGAAKPVPINYWALRSPKKDIILVGAAGPLANFALAWLLSLVLKFLHFPAIAGFLLTELLVVNVVLGVFNLIPIPPLDGSRILMGLLPESLSYKYSQIEPYTLFILIILLWLGIFDRIVWPLVALILGLMGVYI